MVRFNIIVILIFAKLVIYFHAFCVKSKCAAVDAFQIIMIPELQVFVFVQDGLPGLFVVFENEIPLPSL